MHQCEKYAREEGGNNRFQNHLTSLTRVKPGFVHAVALRATLFAINLLSRFWFNVGTLGDIPTILSARWVLIDGGRRLLFLDNYGGAWDSYLNEFIDMTAVKGLNAIWTNTFVEVEGKEGQMLRLSPNAVLFLEGGAGRAAVQGLRAGEPGRDDRMVQRLSDAERREHQYEHRYSTILVQAARILRNRRRCSKPLSGCRDGKDRMGGCSTYRPERIFTPAPFGLCVVALPAGQSARRRSSGLRSSLKG